MTLRGTYSKFKLQISNDKYQIKSKLQIVKRFIICNLLLICDW